MLQERFWSEEAMNLRLDREIEEINSRITLSKIQSETRKPEPYSMPFKKTVTEVGPHDRYSLFWYFCHKSQQC